MNDPGWWYRMEQDYAEREERLAEARAKIKEHEEKLKREAEERHGLPEQRPRGHRTSTAITSAVLTKGIWSSWIHRIP